MDQCVTGSSQRPNERGSRSERSAEEAAPKARRLARQGPEFERLGPELEFQLRTGSACPKEGAEQVSEGVPTLNELTEP